MDAIDRESISAVQKEIQAREGKLHILVNKQVLPYSSFKSSY